MSSGSSIRLPTEAENRTTRALPNPDNSCATDMTSSAKRLLQQNLP
jgi:hypothetical protein